MAINILAGATFAVSAGAPAAQTEAGYEALTFTALTAAQIMDFSGWDDSWETRTDDSYSTAPVGSKKIRKAFGDITLTLKYDKTNTAFYDIITAAYDDQTDLLACKFLSSNAVDALYFQATVIRANIKGGSASDEETFELVLAPQTETVAGTDA